MAGIRKLYGPFHQEEIHEGLRWHFFGIRDDYRVAQWQLTYAKLTRTFGAGSIPLRGADHPVVYRRMFIEGDDSPVLTGRVTDILRNRLSPEQIARAAALSMQARIR